MKILEVQNPGYRDQVLEDFLECTLFPSAFFDQPIPVRGVCFSGGTGASLLAREFAQKRLRLGTVTFNVSKMKPEDWRELTWLLTEPRAEVSKVGFLLPDLGLASEKLQERIAETILAGTGAQWFAGVADHRRIIPTLKRAFLVYLGLGANDRTRFLVQSGQHLRIDEGSLKQPSRNKR